MNSNSNTFDDFDGFGSQNNASSNQDLFLFQDIPSQSTALNNAYSQFPQGPSQINQFQQSYPQTYQQQQSYTSFQPIFQQNSYDVFDNPFNPVETLKYDDDEQLPSSVCETKENTNIQTDDLDSLRLSLRLKKKLIRSSSFNDQSFPMLVSLAAQSLKSSKAAIDLVCVIDHSGSMDGEKMELVKKSFTYLLRFLGDKDRLSIIIFDDRATRLTPLLLTNEINKEKILSNIREVYANGGTDIDLGMKHALQVLKQRRQQNPVSSIFLLSDGLDGGAQNKVNQTLIEMGISDDIIINTFGFGNDHDPKLMNDIAALRDGNFYFIEKLDMVDEAFVDCLGGLLSSIGQNVTIQIKPEQSPFLEGVKITKAYGESSMWAKEGEIYITKISTLISGRQKDFVLELEIPPNTKELLDHEKNVKVASAKFEITLLDNKKIVKEADLVITLLNEGEELENEEEDDREVMKNFYRVKGALVMSDSRVLADKSKNEEAKKILQNFKEELENSFLKNEEFIRNLIRDILKAIDSVNPVVYEQAGKHYMFENARAQMYQKSNLASANCYQNSFQMDMLSAVKSMKSHK